METLTAMAKKRGFKRSNSLSGAGARPWHSSVAVPHNVWRKAIHKSRKGFKR